MTIERLERGHLPGQHELNRAFDEMIAEMRRRKAAGEFAMPFHQRAREFSGREDHDRYQRGEDWTWAGARRET